MKVEHQNRAKSGLDQGAIGGGGGARWTKKGPHMTLAPWRTSQELVATFHTPGATSGVLRLDLSNPDFDPRGRASLGWGGGLSESTYGKK